MSAWDARRASVEIHMWLVVPFAVLAITDFIDEITMAYGEDASTTAVRGFQNCAVITLLGEFISGGETGDTPTQNSDLALVVTQVEQIQ